ncbi:uncharacterized protein LOC127005209 [Eriocheir sinensis]|uniref:uncharacterized protein LOC127005209 n=1 Tax=Eriocheir sinensis TaxID=95602 RepID=UPI0021C88F24|nr:uncharacterized protein LOC127005209 [Eriocheir sinensis]
MEAQSCNNHGAYTQAQQSLMLWLTVAVAGVGAVLMLVLVAMLTRMKRVMKGLGQGMTKEEENIYDEIQIGPKRVDTLAGKGNPAPGKNPPRKEIALKMVDENLYEECYLDPKKTPQGEKLGQMTVDENIYDDCYLAPKKAPLKI